MPTIEDPIFRVAVPTAVPGVPTEVLFPRTTWSDPAEYDRAATRIAAMFHANFAAYADGVSQEVRDAGPIDVGLVDAVGRSGPAEG